MAMGTERSKNLHNFTLPGGLRWGNQRFLRCMKMNSNGQISPLHRFNSDSDSDHRPHHSIQQRRSTRERQRDSSSESMHGSQKMGPTPTVECFGSGCGGRKFNDGDDGIAAIREKVMFDLQTAADKMKDAIFKESLEDGKVSVSPSPPPPPPPPPHPPVAASAEGETYRPWNLRTRRAACKTPSSGFVSGGGRIGSSGTASWSDGVGSGKGLKVDAPKPGPWQSPTRTAAVDNKSPKLRSGATGAAGVISKRREERTGEVFGGSFEERDRRRFHGYGWPPAAAQT
ncbi:Protein of unknown function (DUF1639) [Abeliophyllum distichum]|uniref:Uncharacterized protein n=1 Tax=Abeliophyllum distichum TaxID=126358 RepID=A0ABD1RAJ4_9LAMI